MANKRLQGEKQFHSKNYFLEIHRSHVKNAFEKWTTKTELCIDKNYIKTYALGCSCKCPCTFLHSYT